MGLKCRIFQLVVSLMEKYDTDFNPWQTSTSEICNNLEIMRLDGERRDIVLHFES